MRSVILIGNPRRREFSAFVAWLCAQADLKISAQYETIPAAFEDNNGESLGQVDMTIVLQSWPDQFTKRNVDRLVGHTLFRRLICCYGPWCESDGRNRDIWPDANRVPLRLVQRVVEWEVIRIARDEPAVPPTSARDEIFAYRLGEPEDWAPLPALKEMNAAIISPDAVLRKTAYRLLKDLGMKSLSLPLIRSNGNRRIKPKETSRGPVHIVLHDLDPWGTNVEESLAGVRRMFPMADVLGVATMPDAGLSSEIVDVDIRSVVPKLDMEDGLRWHLQELLATIDFSTY